MQLDGTALRDGFRDLKIDEISYPAEIEVHVGNPDEPTNPLGMAQLYRDEEGNLCATFTLSDLDMNVIGDGTNVYWAVGLHEQVEEGTEDDKDREVFRTVNYLALTDKNIDPNIKPIQAF